LFYLGILIKGSLLVEFIWGILTLIRNHRLVYLHHLRSISHGIIVALSFAVAATFNQINAQAKLYKTHYGIA
jgi:hypothetical protein